MCLLISIPQGHILTMLSVSKLYLTNDLYVLGVHLGFPLSPPYLTIVGCHNHYPFQTIKWCITFVYTSMHISSMGATLLAPYYSSSNFHMNLVMWYLETEYELSGMWMWTTQIVPECSIVEPSYWVFFPLTLFLTNSILVGIFYAYTLTYVHWQCYFLLVKYVMLKNS